MQIQVVETLDFAEPVQTEKEVVDPIWKDKAIEAVDPVKEGAMEILYRKKKL
jgi:hypothetical protein